MNFDLAAKPLVGPPALRGEPQDLVPLKGIVKEDVPAPSSPRGFVNFVTPFYIFDQHSQNSLFSLFLIHFLFLSVCVCVCV